MIYLFTPWETKMAMDKWPIETDDLQMIYLLKNGDFPVRDAKMSREFTIFLRKFGTMNPMVPFFVAKVCPCQRWCHGNKKSRTKVSLGTERYGENGMIFLMVILCYHYGNLWFL